jgi:hypothetical protein
MPKVVFVTGAARSGTTWLQNILGAHPEIVTPQESDLFNYYVAPLYREWRKSLPESEAEWQARRHNGLPAIITEDEFDEMVGEVIGRIYGRVAELKPSASVVLDKVPGYGMYAGLIFRQLPDARILQIIRDGRDVAMSLRRASKGFGRTWAASQIDYAAWTWTSNIEACRHLEESEGYAEVRYEALRGPEAAEELWAAFEFFGVNPDAVDCQALVEQFSLERTSGRPPSSMVWSGEVMKRLAAPPSEPSDFFGAGSVGGWRDGFDWYDRWLFDRCAGEMVVELGYESDRSWVGVGRARAVGGLLRFHAERWWVLLGSLTQKVRLNLRARKRALPEAAVVGGADSRRDR